MKRLFLLFTAFFAILLVSNAQTTNADAAKGAGGIVYYPKPPNNQLLDLSLKDECQQKVHGTISDMQGNPLEGVTAVILPNDTFLIADKDGKFAIAIEEKPIVIHITHIGYYPLAVVLMPEHRGQILQIELALAERDIHLLEPYQGGGGVTVGKPLLYLYPETSTKISIINHFKGELLTTYPAYNGEWTVIAEPNGKLLNLADNKNYNWLFWDGLYNFPASHYDFKEGFYVEKKNYANFLQEKLALIGLSETELNDFIVYWLPILNQNEVSFIHFGVNDDLGNSSRLEVNPKPDTMIRVLMEYKKYTGGAKLPEQKLPSILRKKFTLVEWGGAKIEDEIIDMEMQDEEGR